MLFYCPNCQEEYEIEPSSTATTKSNRLAYKANCPVCALGLVEFIPPQPQAATTTPLDQTLTSSPASPEKVT